MDNVSQAGNLIAPVDSATGVVGQVIAGNGLSTHVVSKHPRSGVALEGTRLPQWDEALRCCLRAARLFPSFHVQSWDIALTTRGPVVLEVNPVGGALGHQLAYGRGFLQDDMRTFLERVGGL